MLSLDITRNVIIMHRQELTSKFTLPILCAVNCLIPERGTIAPATSLCSRSLMPVEQSSCMKQCMKNESILVHSDGRKGYDCMQFLYVKRNIARNQRFDQQWKIVYHIISKCREQGNSGYGQERRGHRSMIWAVFSCCNNQQAGSSKGWGQGHVSLHVWEMTFI